MIAHVVEATGTAKQISRAVQTLESDVNPVLCERAGFVDSMCLVDGTAGRMLLITLWEDDAASRASEGRWQKEGWRAGALEAAGLERRILGQFEVAYRLAADCEQTPT